jgi:uncharacterized protein (TIGR03067 family)
VSEWNAGQPNRNAADNGYWFHPKHVIVGSQDWAWEWPIRVDATCSPHTIDMWSTDSTYVFNDLGIWELTGGRLRLCWGLRDSGVRPNKFASTLDNGWELLELAPWDEPEPI